MYWVNISFNILLMYPKFEYMTKGYRNTRSLVAEEQNLWKSVLEATPKTSFIVYLSD